MSKPLVELHQSRTIYMCKMCNNRYVYKNATNLETHQREKCRKQKAFSCDRCENKQFDTEAKLKRHQRTKTCIKKYEGMIALCSIDCTGLSIASLPISM